MTAGTLNIIGLVSNLFGVVLLFRYGMPYRVRRGGASYFRREQDDEDEKRAEARYDAFGWVGIALIVLGTGFQVAANVR